MTAAGFARTVIIVVLIASAVALPEPGETGPGRWGPFRNATPVPAEAGDRYPFVWDFPLPDLQGGDYRLASDGALELNYGERYGGAGWRYNAVFASLYCLRAYNGTLDGDDTGSIVVQQARGLIARAQPSGDGWLWRYDFPQATFGARAGWISGMAQGLAMGCFAAAHSLTGEQRYASAAASAFEVLVAPFGDEGTATSFGGGTFYEEVAGAGSKPAHILNGMIYTLAGLHLAARLTPDPRFDDAFEAGARGVRGAIDLYDAPGVSLYDRGPKRIARLHDNYNLVHVAQLHWMYDRTADPHFLKKSLLYLSHEQPLPYRVRASSGGDASGVTGRGGYWSGKRGRTETLTFSFDGKFDLSSLGLIAYSDSTVPAKVEVFAGGKKASVSPRGRFLRVPLKVRGARSATVRLTPKPRQRTGLFLASFARTAPPPASISSDLSVYWTSGRPDSSTLLLADGDPATGWSSDDPHPYLLSDLGASRRSVAVEPCATGRNAIASFSHDMRWWTEAEAITLSPGGSLDVPAGARYLLLRWPSGGGCLKGVG